MNLRKLLLAAAIACASPAALSAATPFVPAIASTTAAVSEERDVARADHAAYAAREAAAVDLEKFAGGQGALYVLAVVLLVVILLLILL